MVVRHSGVDPVSAVASIEKEIKKDDRVQTAVATYSFTDGDLLVNVAVTLTGGETFALVGQATDLSTGSFQFSVAQTTS
jgi:hypothetical protein